MGSKPKSKSVSYSGSSNPAFLPYAKGAINDVNSDYQSAQPVAKEAIEGVQSLGNSLGDKFQSGLATAGQAQGHWGNVLSGKYMQGNPYMDGMLARMRGDVGNDVNSRAALSGRYGSDMHYGALTRELANAENQMLFNDYNMQSGRMDQAATAAQMSNTGDAQQQLQALAMQGEMPYAGMQAYGNSLGAIFNGGSSKSTQTGPSPIWGAIGQGLGAAGSYFGAGGTLSSREAKTDIELLYRDPDGLGWYNFRYKSDPSKTILKGVMADEVKELRPEAYIPNFKDGMAGVNYAKLAA